MQQFPQHARVPNRNVKLGPWELPRATNLGNSGTSFLQRRREMVDLGLETGVLLLPKL